MISDPAPVRLTYSDDVDNASEVAPIQSVDSDNNREELPAVIAKNNPFRTRAVAVRNATPRGFGGDNR